MSVNLDRDLEKLNRSFLSFYREILRFSSENNPHIRKSKRKRARVVKRSSRISAKAKESKIGNVLYSKFDWEV